MFDSLFANQIQFAGYIFPAFDLACLSIASTSASLTLTG